MGKRGLEDEEMLDNNGVKKTKLMGELGFNQAGEFSLIAGPADQSYGTQ